MIVYIIKMQVSLVRTKIDVYQHLCLDSSAFLGSFILTYFIFPIYCFIIILDYYVSQLSWEAGNKDKSSKISQLITKGNLVIPSQPNYKVFFLIS